MSDLDLVQLLFDSEPVTSALGFPVNAAAFAKAVTAVRKAADQGSPERIAAGWNALAGSLGPALMASLLSGEEWRWICRPTRPLDDFDCDDHSQAVWVGDESVVIGRAQFDGTHLLGVRFDVVPR